MGLLCFVSVAPIPDASTATSTSVQWVELTPDDVAQRIIHVVMTGILIGVTFLGVALQLQALDHALAGMADA
jgi:hypothetical protein